MIVFLGSILGRIIRVTDEVIQYRHWIQEKFPVDNGGVGGLPALLPLETHSNQQGSNSRLQGKRCVLPLLETEGILRLCLEHTTPFVYRFDLLSFICTVMWETSLC